MRTIKLTVEIDGHSANIITNEEQCKKAKENHNIDYLHMLLYTLIEEINQYKELKDNPFIQ